MSITPPTPPPDSGQRRVRRGWVILATGCVALAAPLVIDDWGLLFAFTLAPMGLFILAVGIVEIIRGAAEADRNR